MLEPHSRNGVSMQDSVPDAKMRPIIRPNIDLGNIIQIMMLIVSIAVGYAYVQITVSANVEKIDDLEERMRVVERSTGRVEVNISSLQRSMDELRAEMRENNQLIRRMITYSKEDRP